MRTVAKSDHGLPAWSGATKRQISREHYDLQCKLAFGNITFVVYEKKLKELKKQGKA